MDGLELHHVVIIHRHGERTPVRVRLAHVGVPAHWNMCSASRFFGSVERATGAAGGAAAAAAPRPLLPGLFEWRVEHMDSRGGFRDLWERHKNACMLGQLTDKGLETTRALGQRLRRRYVDEMRFLPSQLQSVQQVYLRTSAVPRAVESLLSVFSGLYDESRDRAAHVVPRVHSRIVSEETIYSNSAFCPRFFDLSCKYAAAAAQRHNLHLARWQERLSDVLQGSKLEVEGRPRLSGLADTVKAAMAHGIDLPPELTDPELHRDINAAIVDEWFTGYLVDAEYRRLGIGPLLGDMLDRIAASLDPSTRSESIAIFSGHDTTIAPVLAALEVFDGQWPEFTSSIAVETFRDRDARPDRARTFYVGLRYNDEPLALPACAPLGRHHPAHPNLCTYEAFRDAVEKIRPANWQSECARK